MVEDRGEFTTGSWGEVRETRKTEKDVNKATLRLYNELMSKSPDRIMPFTNREAWRAWLEGHHAAESEAWVLIGKKAAARQFLTLDEAVEEALCFGWIDGVMKSIDRESIALRFTPRRSHSIWSVSNQRRVERLVREGRMTPAGMAKVAEAKESGEWDAAIAREDASSVPDDLARALEEAGAWSAFEGWTASQKKQYLYWLESAKRPETREKRVLAIVGMAKRGR